ncbi:MAG: recombinase family protein [Lachnospiraceae bacterium]|nr:recombinase family protein [Lachnospiraceae bacterium]
MNKKQAETIKMIYKLYLLGKSLYGIKQELKRLNLETPMHKKV